MKSNKTAAPVPQPHDQDALATDALDAVVAGARTPATKLAEIPSVERKRGKLDGYLPNHNRTIAKL